MSLIKFRNSPVLNKAQLDKVGNAIIYLSKHVPNLYQTKLLKLVYLIDELSTKETGIPLLGLQYKVWQAGPVNRDLYIDINDGSQIFKDYFETVPDRDGIKIVAKKDFNDDEFSDRDIQILDRIIELYGNTSGQGLVSITHRPASLWFRKAKETGLLELFDKGLTNSSEEELDLGELLNGQEDKAGVYQEHLHFLQTQDALQNVGNIA